MTAISNYSGSKRSSEKDLGCGYSLKVALQDLLIDSYLGRGKKGHKDNSMVFCLNNIKNELTIY